MTQWTGAIQLVRFAARRDRLLVGLWTLVLVGICYASAAATASLYPHVADRVAVARSLDTSPSIVALYGPILDVRSLGEVAMTKMTVLYAVFVALLALVVVRRHTRTEEESGQAELLGGTVVGRDAPLVAAVAYGALVSLVVGLLAALADIAGSLPVGGSLAFGACWVGTGLVATALTALACQLSASARTCASIAGGGLGVLFVLRAVGDTSVSWLSWLTPFGWNTQLRAWSGTRWWVLLLYVAATAVLLAAAQVLRGRRDLGAGMIAARPGPAHGSPRLRDVVSLSLRLHVPMLITWSVAMAVLGTVLGSIAPNLGSMLDSPGARELLERIGGRGALADTMAAAEISMCAVVISCFAIAVVGHVSGDEHDGRTEQVLATGTSRSRALAATLLVTLLGTTWLLLVTGVAIGLGYGAAAGSLVVGSMTGAALAQAPAVWLVSAIAVATYTVRSGWAVLGWVFLVLFLTLGQLGELLKLPQWAIDLSPYVHSPRMPVESFSAGPAAVLTLLAVVLLVASWLRFRARDIG